MIECTLQEAIERCKKDGGRFKELTMDKWLILQESSNNIVFEKTGDHLVFNAYYFSQTWIYEPPKKSAFHCAIGQYAANVKGTPNDFRKEGWNAAIDEMFKLAHKVGNLEEFGVWIGISGLKELKEE